MRIQNPYRTQHLVTMALLAAKEQHAHAALDVPQAKCVVCECVMCVCGVCVWGGVWCVYEWYGCVILLGRKMEEKIHNREERVSVYRCDRLALGKGWGDGRE